MPVEVNFHDKIDDNLLKFAVIIAKTDGKWVFCKHKERETYEIPGGHREENETILDTARRELYEETGAVIFDITPICVYSVTETVRNNPKKSESEIICSIPKESEVEIEKSTQEESIIESSGNCTYGMLYFADIKSFEEKLHSEIEKIWITEELPNNWTYPLIQPKLIEEAKRRSKQCREQKILN